MDDLQLLTLVLGSVGIGGALAVVRLLITRWLVSWRGPARLRWARISVWRGENSSDTGLRYTDLNVATRPAVTRPSAAGADHYGPDGVLPAEETLLRLLSPARGNVVVLVGDAGSGKSTVLRNLAAVLASRSMRTRRRPVPILLNLPDCREAAHSHALSIAEIARHAWTAREILGPLKQRWLSRGRCVLLLDALDEIVDPYDRVLVLSWLREQMAAYPGNSWIVATRPLAARPLPAAPGSDPGFGFELGFDQPMNLWLQPLTPEQMGHLVRAQYALPRDRPVPVGREPVGREPVSEAADRAESSVLGWVRRNSLEELAADPLVLRLIVSLYQYEDSLERVSAPDIYAQVWELHQRRASPHSYRLGSRGAVLAGALALQMLSRGRSRVSGDEAVRIMAGEEGLRGSPGFLGEYFDWLRESGVLSFRRDGYGFALDGMRDYLAAEYLRGDRRVSPLTEQILNPSWYGTILMWSAMADASPVIEACLDVGTPPVLALARRCAEVSPAVAAGLRRELRRMLAEDAERGAPAAELRPALAGTTSALAQYVEERHPQPADPAEVDLAIRRVGYSWDPRAQEHDPAVYFAAAAACAGRAESRDVDRLRFRGLIGLALRMRAQHRGSSRDLCLAALTCLDRRERHRSDLALAITVYLGADPQDRDLDARDVPAVTHALLRHLREVGPGGFETVVPLLAAHEDAAALVHLCVRADLELKDYAERFLTVRAPGAMSAPDAWADLAEEWRLDRSRLIRGLSALCRLTLDRDALREAGERLAGQRETAPKGLADDLDGLADALAALGRSLDDWRFDQQDAALRGAVRIAREVRATVAAAPTALAVELVEPAAAHIEVLADTARRRLARALPPRPDVTAALPAARLRDDTVTFQVRVGNAEGSAPVQSGWLEVGVGSGGFAPATQRVDLPAVVPGGGSATVPVRLDLTEADSDAAAVEVTFTLRHTARGGAPAAAVEGRLSLAVDRAFDPIDPNPFSTGALGRPVDDPRMFYGRDELLGRVRARLREAASPGVGIAVFGQKRTGKSSIRLQLMRLLAEEDGLPVVDVGNLGELLPTGPDGVDERVLGLLLWRILDGADRAAADGPRLLPAGFDRERLIASPDPVMDCADLFRRYRQAHPQCPPWVVFIDEFQYLDQWIREGLVPASIMRAFKAIVERQLFHLVLVGQSDLERLIAADPNAFGVFGIERVSYLAEPGARALIEEPVPLPAGSAPHDDGGPSRYRGRAVEEVIRLSGGNPFYIQRFCSVLVDHMNAERAATVTEADVAQVADGLVSALRAGDFDNLESPATADARWTAADVRTVLAAVANATRELPDGGAATLREIEHCHPGPLPDGLLEDLVARQIVRGERDGYRIVVGVYEAWLRRYFGPPERPQSSPRVRTR
ncbi:NACHT domain-containing protein [Streptomyces sp. V4-01]|uniref:NACHT domain-containing protein n=1 Tax=Actinacidiphila polyblastidii TaxID=3110430 RepID=A0ABU7P7R9_9ACTN|nr:NACHT domain-containing protein [Streptomyces sp. V4-01]